jgi:hypothetical protein
MLFFPISPTSRYPPQHPALKPPSACFSLSLHPCRTTSKIMVLCEDGRNLMVQQQITSTYLSQKDIVNEVRKHYRLMFLFFHIVTISKKNEKSSGSGTASTRPREYN